MCRQDGYGAAGLQSSAGRQAGAGEFLSLKPAWIQSPYQDSRSKQELHIWRRRRGSRLVTGLNNMMSFI